MKQFDENTIEIFINHNEFENIVNSNNNVKRLLITDASNTAMTTVWFSAEDRIEECSDVGTPIENFSDYMNPPVANEEMLAYTE